MQVLGPELTSLRARPKARILQFGGGNFLRGFLDWKIDRLNEATGSDWGIVIVRAIADGAGSSLNAQAGLYTVVSRGIDEAGEAVSEPRVVTSVLSEVFANTEWDSILGFARDPDITVVTSNTTETGIVYDAGCAYSDNPPASYPAKLTRLLHERWKHFSGDPAMGWQVIPCELIDRNADELLRIVLLHAADWKLEATFVDWLNGANAFYGTLVDRIVPGYPRDEVAALSAQFGYEDRFMLAAELFHFLAIERKPDQPPLRIPLADYDDGTLVTTDVTPYKVRKVKILNGAHTALCPLAILSGIETVREAVTTPAGQAFLKAFLEKEVIPFVDMPEDELKAFAEAVLRRFANPYIRHRWHDISLNAIAKFQVRIAGNMKGQVEHFGHVLPLTAMSLSAWLVFYTGRYAGAERTPPRDIPAVTEKMKAISALDDGTAAGREAMVSAFLGEASFWGEPLNYRGLKETVLADLALLTAEPVTLERVMDRLK